MADKAFKLILFETQFEDRITHIDQLNLLFVVLQTMIF